MGSDSKGGEASKRYNYHGTLAGAVCVGPVDSIKAVIYDNSIWLFNGTVTRSSDSPADLTASIDPKYLTKGGYLKFYWGTDAQPMDLAWSIYAAPNSRPRYPGVAYIAAKGLLFGTEKTSAPNLSVIVERKPVVDTAIVAAIDNTIDDGQVNPVAAIAELISSTRFGAGLPVARFDTASWQAAAAYARSRKDLSYCSPLLSGTGDLRASIGPLLAMFDGALAWDSQGKLVVKLLKPGVNPGGLITLDAGTFTDGEMPRLASQTWASVPTTIAVKYFDRSRKYKSADEAVHNPFAEQVRGDQKLATVEMPHITRRTQCAAWASEYMRRAMLPSSQVSLSVRPERVSGLTVGDKVIVDVDPEPGGAGLAQLAVITDRRDAYGKPTKLTLQCDPLTSSTPFSPTPETENPTEVPVPAIVHALVVPLPQDAFQERFLRVG